MNDARRNIQVVLTIDTEPDDAWRTHLNPSVANIEELRRLQGLLDQYGAKATCLITYRVVDDEAARRVLHELVDEGGAEVGAHLHPWENPPFSSSRLEVKHPAYPHELPIELFKRKLSNLVGKIEKHFGRPTSYRAGRWGLASEHVRVLEDEGLEVDSSVVPWMDFRPNLGLPPGVGLNWTTGGGIDYRRTPREAYYPDYADVSRRGPARLLEIPVSVAFTRVVPPWVRKRYGTWPLFSQRVLGKSGLLRPVWALPAQQNREALAQMVRALLEEQPGHVNIAFHSSELRLGASPRSRTVEEVDALMERIDMFLAMLSNDDRCHFATLSEAGAVLSRSTSAVA